MPGAQPTGPMPVYVVATPPKTDWANYIYECSVIVWRVITNNFIRWEGRVSRREFWSFWVFWMFFSTFCCCTFFVFAIPMLCVWIRRLHDINRSGWWCLVPFVCLLMCLKKSDEGPNEYGYPEPASDILNN